MKARIVIYTIVALYLILTVVAAVFVITDKNEAEPSPDHHGSIYQQDTMAF